MLAGIEHTPGHIEQEDEARLRSGTQSGLAAPSGTPSPTLKNGNKLALPVAETESNKRPIFTEAQHIHGHLAQEGDAKLRLGGAIAPEVPPLAAKDGSKSQRP